MVMLSKNEGYTYTLLYLQNYYFHLLQLMIKGGKRKTINNGVFHIRLGANVQKIDLKDPVFLKILQQQYATKYLQSMGVQSTSKNIAKILKERPLDSCQIVESRLTGGLHTDTITIITRSQTSSTAKTAQSQTVSSEMLKILDLKKMAQKKEVKILEKKIETAHTKKVEVEQQKKGLSYLQFDIKSIKLRYIFPFNENFNRKNNYKMKDQSNLIQKDKEQSNLIFESGIFHFPFTQVKLSLNALKQLQSPVTVKFSDVMSFLESFYLEFPKEIFPIQDSTKKGLHKQIHITFDKKSVDTMFQIIRSDENAKMIGVFLHLSYWAVFGGVNPLQIDSSMKKKMFLMISETIKYFQLKTQIKKNWMTLVQPMILLTLKMSLDYFFHMQYPKLFFSQQSVKVGANELAFDKILLFVDKILDQSNINGRFIFLESDIDGPKGNFMKDKKFIRKRIFGTSPGLQLILPQPKDGKARSIMAKNIQIDQKQGTLQQNAHYIREEQDKQCRQKLLNLALLKIRNRVEQISGSNPSNPIIRLQDKD